MNFTEKGSWFMGKRFEGEVDGYFVEAQVFGEPSQYGISQGKISRLIIYPDRSAGFNRCLANYDRGWDGGPPKSELRTIVEKVVHYFDQKSVDWAFEERR
jgi:hypothetical protein